MKDCSVFITLALESQQKVKSHLHYIATVGARESLINTSVQQSRLLGLTVLQMLLLHSFRHQIVVDVLRDTLTLHLLKLREHAGALAKTWEQLSPTPAKLRLVPSLLMLPAPNSPSSHPTLLKPTPGSLPTSHYSSASQPTTGSGNKF